MKLLTISLFVAGMALFAMSVPFLPSFIMSHSFWPLLMVVVAGMGIYAFLKIGRVI